MTLYIFATQKTVVNKQDAYVRDAAKVFCRDKQLLKEAQALHLAHFEEKDKKQKVINLYDVFCDFMEKHAGCEIQFLEETTILIEYERNVKHPVWDAVKIIFVCFICFFGAAFTIMAFHNDIGITELFDHVYVLFLGIRPDGLLVLEIAYSLGLGTGIILFFNHLGGKKITKDPTPVEVAMSSYETEVNTTIIEQEKQN